MEINEKTIWKKASIMGLVFSFLCLSVSVYQFYSYSDAVTFSNAIMRLSSLLTNTIMFCCFIMTAFKPHNFLLYTIAFYIYGFGNLLDGGHMLCFVCMGLSALFIYFLGGFEKCRPVKIIVFAIPIFLGLGTQWINYNFFFALITLFHGLGFCFMAFIAFCLVYPKVLQYKKTKVMYCLDPSFYTQRDVSWLNQVIEGKRYVDIAVSEKISESSVKARMSEIYKSLNISGKSEFMAMYRNRNFTLTNSAEPSEEK